MRRLFALLAAPLVLAAPPLLSEEGSLLAWTGAQCPTDETFAVVEFRVFRDGALATTLPANVPTFAHGGIAGDYTVRAFGYCLIADAALAVETEDSNVVTVVGAPPPPPECDDGVDNDGDGQIDLDDDGCTDALDDDETDPPPPAQCADGVDNDGDTFIDLADIYGCLSAADDDEANPQCSDGIDNDGDGEIDYLEDDGCVDGFDDEETDPSGAALQGYATIDANLGTGSAPIVIPPGTTKIVATYDFYDLGFNPAAPEFRVDGAVMTPILHQGDVGYAPAYGAQVIDATAGSVFSWDWAGNINQLVEGGLIVLHFVDGTSVTASGGAGEQYDSLSITPSGTLNLAVASKEGEPGLASPYVDSAYLKERTYDAAVVTGDVQVSAPFPALVVIEVD